MPLAAWPADAAVTMAAEPGRFTLGALPRGGEAQVEVTLRNGGDEPADVAFAFENTEGAVLSVVPNTLALAAGAAALVTIRLEVPTDAAPGRHGPAVVASATSTGSGNQAVAAVRLPLDYTVPVADIAYAQVLANGTFHARIVNGHDASRQIEVTFETRVGNAVVEALTSGPEVVAPGRSLLVYWPLDAGLYPDGTHVLTATGAATGGPAPEPIGLNYALYADGGALALDLDDTPPAGGQQLPGGGGCRPGRNGCPDATPTPGAPPPTRDIMVRPDDGETGASGGNAGDGGIPAADEKAAEAARAAERAQAALVAVGVLTAAGALLFLGRKGPLA